MALAWESLAINIMTGFLFTLFLVVVGLTLLNYGYRVWNSNRNSSNNSTCYNSIRGYSSSSNNNNNISAKSGGNSSSSSSLQSGSCSTCGQTVSCLDEGLQSNGSSCGECRRDERKASLRRLDDSFLSRECGAAKTGYGTLQDSHVFSFYH